MSQTSRRNKHGNDANVQLDIDNESPKMTTGFTCMNR